MSELGATLATSMKGSFTLGMFLRTSWAKACLITSADACRLIQTKLESVSSGKPCEAGLEHSSMHHDLYCTKACASSKRITVNRDHH